MPKQREKPTHISSIPAITSEHNIIIMTSRRQRQRHFTHESSLSATSLPKTHRLPSLFGCSDSYSNISNKPSPIKTDDPPSVTWSSRIIASSPESKIIRLKTLGGGEDTSSSAYELVRQLSFSPIRETKKRANTAETEVGSSSSSDSETSGRHSSGLDLEQLDLDLKQVYPLRHRRSRSPLMGLKYLPEEDKFI